MSSYAHELRHPQPPLAHDQQAAISDQTDAATMLYKSVIGPINYNYYLRVFAHFDAKGKTGILWH